MRKRAIRDCGVVITPQNATCGGRQIFDVRRESDGLYMGQIASPVRATRDDIVAIFQYTEFRSW